ncbi:unnamed protein product [Oikopleura dioica]|uniref:Calpain catalytic domain-containing protein n=1 Tax=Oikopleura dioica TaxID=34765 RepID=E4XHF7_OIKDI|nr:unnamed protein product [Oikopleura dioica]
MSAEEEEPIIPKSRRVNDAIAPIRLNQLNAGLRTERRTFEEIREQHLTDFYEDPEFPAIPASLFCTNYNRPSNADQIEWLRPRDICQALDLPVRPWRLLASRSNGLDFHARKDHGLGLQSGTFERNVVLKQGQSFNHGEYCGAFIVQIWQYGKWMDVIVDDRLPTINGELVYLSSASKNEFWSAIIEKAYAKLNGSYEALRGGSITEALCDFTGGICETYDLGEHGFRTSSVPEDLFKITAKAFKRGAVGGASLEFEGSGVESRAQGGLIAGHAYSVQNALTLSNGTKLICLRNPWGQAEWNGAYSDGSSQWVEVADEVSQLTGGRLRSKNDGEFWMEFEDFLTWFSKLELCSIPESIGNEEEAHANWVTQLCEGRWTRNISAGGCTNFMTSRPGFPDNPQFPMGLIDVDEDDETKCTAIISLIQADANRRRDNKDLLTIGFIVYKLTGENIQQEPLDVRWFRSHRSVGRSDFSNSREVTKRLLLDPGNYVIVPCTFQPQEESAFVLRIFTEKKQDFRNELSAQTSIEEDDSDRPITQENEEAFYRHFQNISGRDLAISAWELQNVLNRVVERCYRMDDAFSIETCRALVAAGDPGCIGKLGYDDFRRVWIGVRKWLEIFIKFDKDKSGKFDVYELRSALRHAGMNLSTTALKVVVHRYANEERVVSLTDFVLVAVRLKQAIIRYKRLQPDMSIDQWLLLIIYS